MKTWHYRCFHCATWAVTVMDAGRYVRCNGCGGMKKFMFTDFSVDPEVYAYARQHGIAHLPIPREQLITCVRCGEDKPHTFTRPDGMVCRECFEAEGRPELAPMTPEAAAEKAKRDREWERFGMYERQDAAKE